MQNIMSSSLSTTIDGNTGSKGFKAFGIVFSVLLHLAVFALLAVSHKKVEPPVMDEEPIAITMLEVSAPTGQWTESQEQQPVPPAPEPEIAPPDPEPLVEPIVEEPPKPVEPEPVVEPPKPEPITVEPPKPVVVEPPKPADPPKKPDPKPVEKPKQPTMEERMAVAKSQGAKKTDPPKPQPPPRQVSAEQLYKPTPNSGAAIHGNVNIAGRSKQEADAVAIYSGIITQSIRDLWQTTYGPKGLNNPTPVKIEFTVSSTGMVSGFRIVESSNSSVMNTQANALGRALQNKPLTSFKASGISNMPSDPIPCVFVLKYENR